MDWAMLGKYNYLWLLLSLGFFMSLSVVGVSRILRPSAPNNEKNSAYECGEVSLFIPQKGFGLKYLTLALLFVLFELETILLFPWARYWGTVTGKAEQLFLSLELSFFVLLLLLGLLCAYRKGALQWQKNNSKSLKTPSNSLHIANYQALIAKMESQNAAQKQ